MFCRYVLPASGLSLNYLKSVFHKEKFLILIRSHLSFFSSIESPFFLLYLKTYQQSQDHLDSLLYYLLEIFDLQFILQIYFKLISVKHFLNMQMSKCFSTICLKGYSSSTELFLLLCQRSVGYICGVYLVFSMLFY